jgi:hypothetical protein
MPPTTVIARWLVGSPEPGTAPHTVSLQLDRQFTCTCLAWQNRAIKIHCVHILKVRGVKTSETLRMAFLQETAEGYKAGGSIVLTPPAASKHHTHSKPKRKISFEED